MELFNCAEACSTVIEAKPPNASDLINVAEDFLVTRVGAPWDNSALLGGVGAGLIPLCLVPREGGILAVPRSGRSVSAGGGDLDFPLALRSRLPP